MAHLMDWQIHTLIRSSQCVPDSTNPRCVGKPETDDPRRPTMVASLPPRKRKVVKIHFLTVGDISKLSPDK
jgi:hypothetical protein